MTFRCSDASEARGESQVGTASTVRRFLLLEHPGSWGVEAVRDARLPAAVRNHLQEVASTGMRTLLIRGQQGDGTRVFVATEERLSSAVLPSSNALVDLDPYDDPRLTPYDGTLFLVCTHGRHDTCCAERGRPLWEAMRAVAPGETWQVSHIGGDRFAGNVLVLPDGLYYGRVAPHEAETLVATHRRGELDLAHLRGRCAFPFAVQAAEIFLREHLGARGIDDLRLLSRAGTVSSFAVGDQVWDVDVVSSGAAEQRLTCRSVRPSAAPVHALRGPVTRA